MTKSGYFFMNVCLKVRRKFAVQAGKPKNSFGLHKMPDTCCDLFAKVEDWARKFNRAEVLILHAGSSDQLRCDFQKINFGLGDMLRNAVLHSLATTWAVLVCPSVAVSSEWLVSKERAQCVFEHIDLYRSSATDPVVIFVNACPVVDPAEALIALQTNNALPSVRETQDVSGTDDVIVFSQEELDCLSVVSIDISGPIVAIPKVPCD